MVSPSVPTAQRGVDFAVEPLFTLPEGCTPDAMTRSGHGFTVVELDDELVRVYWDGNGGEPFQGLTEQRDETTAIFVSDDHEHVAYVGERDGMFFVGRDGHEDPPVEAFSRSVPPVFSHGGVHLAYGADRFLPTTGGEPEFELILDGHPINTMPVAPFQAVFSPLGERLAYVEMRKAADGGAELRVVLDGEPGAWFRGLRNAVGAMRFSPDGERFAFYRTDERGGGQWVVDGEPQPICVDQRPLSLARFRGIGIVEPELPACFSPDGRRFAYTAELEGGGVAVIEPHTRGPRFKAAGMPVYSPDSQHLAYVAETPEKSLCLLVDGEAGPTWTATTVGTPIFSPDSQHTALLFAREERRMLRKHKTVGCVVDGRVIVEVDGDHWFGDPIFGPDSEHVAWWYEDDDLPQMMVDAEPFPSGHIANSGAVFTSAGHLVFAAIVMPQGRETIMEGWRPGPLADVVHPDLSTKAVFVDPRTGDPSLPFAVSPDGAHIAWAGMFGDESRPVLDDRLGPPFDFVLSALFDASGAPCWWAQRDETVYRVTAAGEGEHR